ncbi:acyl-CoA thioesterase [Sphingobacterium corticibacter]|uniref:Acyl-CoA thioesterase n=1 Tax=Sphingobacterium corticibacter TaxID=2171749 RepID=A0A2T8HNU2_9SPHI|nr:acyl-CoA thioesterase [Sphingobacterium corticibacter]PVH27107.1 acyl-CoA thioesterase [Sphingobacterium corticibacter]
MNTPLVFQFISEPSDVNYGGKVHGGSVMKWIDQAGYACASTWSGRYCVTVYVGGIRFYQPIKIGQIVKVEAHVIYTGSTSMHIAIDVYARDLKKETFEKKTHCIIVFVATDDDGKSVSVPKWIPYTEEEKKQEEYAKRLMVHRKQIEEEMKPFL